MEIGADLCGELAIALTVAKYHAEPTLSRQMIIALVINASVKRARQKIARRIALRRFDVSAGMLGWMRPAPESIVSSSSKRFLVSKTMSLDGGRDMVCGYGAK